MTTASRLIGSRIIALIIGAAAPLAVIEAFPRLADTSTFLAGRGLALEIASTYYPLIFLAAVLAIARLVRLVSRDWTRVKQQRFPSAGVATGVHGSTPG